MQICSVSCLLELLNYCTEFSMLWLFSYSQFFFLFCEAQQSYAAHQNVLPIVMDD